MRFNCMRCHIDLRLILSALLALVITCALTAVPAAAQGTGYSISVTPNPVEQGSSIAIEWSKPAGASYGFFGLYKATNFSTLVSFTFPIANGNSGTASL